MAYDYVKENAIEYSIFAVDEKMIDKLNIFNATYWGMGLESSISPTSSVDYVGPYKPLASGFNYEKLGVIPKFPAAYK